MKNMNKNTELFGNTNFTTKVGGDDWYEMEAPDKSEGNAAVLESLRLWLASDDEGDHERARKLMEAAGMQVNPFADYALALVNARESMRETDERRCLELIDAAYIHFHRAMAKGERRARLAYLRWYLDPRMSEKVERWGMGNFFYPASDPEHGFDERSSHPYIDDAMWLLVNTNLDEDVHSTDELVEYLYLFMLQRVREREVVSMLMELGRYGRPDMCYLLGCMYLNGRGGLYRDEQVARRLIGIAVRAGHRQARELLARLGEE